MSQDKVWGRVRVRIDSCFTWTLLLKNDYRHTVSNYSCRIMCRILCICLLFAGLMGLFCSPILLCQVSARMGEGCMFATCCQGALIGLRIKLRTQQNIQVNQCAMMLFTNSVNFPWRLSSSNFCVVKCVGNSQSKYKMRLSTILLPLFVCNFWKVFSSFSFVRLRTQIYAN